MMRARYSSVVKPAFHQTSGGSVKPALWMSGLLRVLRRASGLKPSLRSSVFAKEVRR